jgi:hypothetical protein
MDDEQVMRRILKLEATPEEATRLREVVWGWVVDCSRKEAELEGDTFTEAEVEETKTRFAAEIGGPELSAMLLIVQRAQKAERDAIEAHLRACGANITADAVRDQRHHR